MDFSQQSIVISGGGSGLGEATARRLAEQGASITVLDINLDQAIRVAEDIGGQSMQCDVSAEKSVEAVFSKLDKLDVCINCAGICPAARILGRDGPMPLQQFKDVIDVNLIGTFNVMRMAASNMIDGGVIINTASIAAFDGQMGQAAYSASKGGIAAMTLPAARELAQHQIRVMTIAPGVFSTPMVTGMPQAVQDRLAKTVPYPSRLGHPEEFAMLVQHIIENPMLNGEVIRLDGALRMAEK